MRAAQLRERIIQRAMDDVDFRSRLLEDPDKALKEEFNLIIPKGKLLKVVENSANTEYLVLPASPELNDIQLANVSGGGARGEIGISDSPLGWSREGNWQEHPIFHD